MRISTNLNKLCVIALFASVACGGRSKKAPIKTPEIVEEAKPQENSRPPEESLPGGQLKNDEKEGIEKEKEDQKEVPKVTEEEKGNAEQDASIPAKFDGIFLVDGEVNVDKTCDQVREKSTMDANKSAAFTLWLGLCQPEFVQNSREGNSFTQEDGNWYFVDASTRKADRSAVATYKDMVSNFYTSLGAINFDQALSQDKLSFSIERFPLILHGYDPTAKLLKVWMDFPTQAPILELLKEPAAKDLFCQSAQLPPEVAVKPKFISGVLPSCKVESSKVEFPRIPPAPAGKTEAENVRNEACHQLRISAAKLGKISSDDLIAWTALEAVPIFSKKGDPHSELMGTEACSDSILGNKSKNSQL